MKKRFFTLMFLTASLPVVGTDKPAEVVVQVQPVIEFSKHLEEKFGTKISAQQESDALMALLAQHKLVVVDFYATWCGPCKKLSPVLEGVAQQTGVTVIKVDVDLCEVITNTYKIQAMPTLLFFNDGVKVKEEVGYKNEAELKNIINSLTKK